MKKKLAIILLGITFITMNSFSQNETSDSLNCEIDSTLILKTKFQRLIKGDFSFLNVDLFDNIYVITNKLSLQKRNSNGDSLYEYNSVTKLGLPLIVDVFNPLKLLVFYKTYASVAVLDKQLSFVKAINFRNKNIISFKAIASSLDNNIWLFDQQDFKLKEFDDELNLLQESTDMRMILDWPPIPSQILQANNQLYLYDENKGFFIFDNYASYKNNLPFKHWKNVGVNNNVLYGFYNNSVYTYQFNTLELKRFKLPDFIRDYKMAKITDGKLYLLKKEGVEIYSIK